MAGVHHTASGNGAALLGLEARDAAWLSRLGGNHSARALQDHLACVEDRLDSNGREGSIKEVGCNRETFLAAVDKACQENAPLPCGLGGASMPRYVAIVNLSGKRMLLTSQTDTMMRKLCSRSWTMHPDQLAEQLGQLAFYIEQQAAGRADLSMIPDAYTPKEPRTTDFILISYSLPWQAGIATAFWEVSAVCIAQHSHGQRRVQDRMVTLSSLSQCIFAARPTLSARVGEGIKMSIGTEAEHTLRFVSTEQVSAFTATYMAVNLDASRPPQQPDAAFDAHGAPAATAAMDAQLRSLLAALRSGRRNDHEEIRALKIATVELKLAQEKQLAHKNEETMRRIESAKSEVAMREKTANDQVVESQVELDRLRATSR